MIVHLVMYDVLDHLPQLYYVTDRPVVRGVELVGLLVKGEHQLGLPGGGERPRGYGQVHKMQYGLFNEWSRDLYTVRINEVDSMCPGGF